MPLKNGDWNPVPGVPLAFRSSSNVSNSVHPVPPGPSSGYDAFERYAPARGAPSYREDFPNNYSSDYWRPERPYYSRSPSPDRFGYSRDSQPLSWTKFMPPDPDVAPWPDKWMPMNSKVSVIRHRPRRENEMMAERMFEPSDTWKQSHSEGPRQPDNRNQAHERHLEQPERGAEFSSADYSSRNDRYSPPRNNWDRGSSRPPPPNSYRRPRLTSNGPRPDPYRPPPYSPGSWNLFDQPQGQRSSSAMYENTQRGASYPMHDHPPPPHMPPERSFQTRERSTSLNPLPAPQRSALFSQRPSSFEHHVRSGSKRAPTFVKAARKPLGIPVVFDAVPKSPPSISKTSSRFSISESTMKIEPPSRDITFEPAPDPSDSIASTPHSETPPNPLPSSVISEKLVRQPLSKTTSVTPPVVKRPVDYTFRIGAKTTRFIPAGTPIDLARPDQDTSLGDEVAKSLASQTSQPEILAISDDTTTHDKANSLRHSPRRSPKGLSIVTATPEPSAASVDQPDSESDMELSSPTSPGTPTKIEMSEPPRLSLPPRPEHAEMLSPVLSSITFRDEVIHGNFDLDRGSAADDSDMDMSPPPTPGRPAIEIPSSMKQEDLSNHTLSVQDGEISESQEDRRPDVPVQNYQPSSQQPGASKDDAPDEDDGESDMDVSLPPSPREDNPILDSEDDELYGNIPAHPPIGPSSSSTFFHELSLSDEVFDDDDSIPGLTITARVKPTASVSHLSTSDSHLDGSTLAMSPRSPMVLTPTVEPLKPSVVTLAEPPSVHSELERAPEQAAKNDVPDNDQGENENEDTHRRSQSVETANAESNITSVENISAEDAFSETLRMVVTMRLRCDRQPREERVEPVLLANQAIAEPPSTQPVSSPDELIREVHVKMQSAGDVIKNTRSSLDLMYSKRQADLTEKVQRLKEEYLSLHRRWLVHCAKLDEVAKANALEEAAATAGRTTRRSTAGLGLGDAVRSDLEMEQIIASLGNEELTDANHLSSRNAADIPDMLSVTNGKVDYLYDDTNNIVDNPAEFYAPRTGIDDWTEEEKAIFLDKYIETPKQFGIIADSLPNKTAAQCVLYYYLHKKKLIDFRKALRRQTTGKRKRGGGRRADKKQKGNALLTDIRKRDDEVSRDAPAKRRKKAAAPPTTEPRKSARSRRTAVQREPTETPSATATPDPESEPRRRRRRAAPTSTAAGSEQGEGEDDPEESKPAKKARRTRKVKQPEITVATPVVYDEFAPMPGETRFIDQTDFTARKKSAQGNASWSEEDKALFLRLLAQHGDDFKRIAASMPNKTTIQVSIFYKTNLAEMDLQRVAAGAPKRSPTPEASSDIWKETSFPGSGVITPTTTALSTPSESTAPPISAAALESRFRFGENIPAPRRIHIQDMPTPSERDRRPRSVASEPSSGSGSRSGSGSASSSAGIQFRSTTAEFLRAQYGESSEHPPRAFAHLQHPRTQPITPVTVKRPSSSGASSRFGGGGVSGRAHAHAFGADPSSGSLTMTFPSTFAYTNLGPSHFANEHRPSTRALHPAIARGTSPAGVTASSTMTFDASMLPQHAWIPSPPPNGRDGGGMPVSLQTTEDLVAYLEHRTRMVGGPPSEFL